MIVTLSLPDKIIAISAEFKKNEIRHAFGGALALAYYGEPRATIDIDVNVFIPPKKYSDLRVALDPLGISGDVLPKVLESRGQCRLWWDRTPIDTFFAYDPLHEAMGKQLRLVPFGDNSRIPILSPEHLTVCKVIFNRPKDWLDIEQILICVENLDFDEIGKWLGRIVGEDDSRTVKFKKARTGLRSAG